MLRRLKITLAVLFLLSVVPMMVFAGGFARSGIGMKALSMGGAFRGIANDHTAAYWNPAGLFQVEGTSVGASFNATTPLLTYTPDVPELGAENGLEIYNKSKTYYVPEFATFAKFGSEKQYTVGIGFYVPYGLGTEWNTYHPPAGFGGEAENYPEFESQSEIVIFDIHPAFSVYFNEKISAGFGVSFYRGSMKMRRTYLSETGFPQAPYDYLPLDSYIEGDGWGMGVNAGLFLTPNDKLRIGLAVRSGSTLSMSGDAEMDVYFPENQAYETLFPELFNGQKLSSTVDAETDFYTPADVGVGFSYKVMENLTLAMDINQTYWRTAMEEIEIDFEGYTPAPEGTPEVERTEVEDSELIAEWDDTIRFSFGTEYQFNPMMAFRAGYYFDPTPIPNRTYRPTWADCGDKHSLNLGMGLNLDPISIDLAYEYVMMDDREILTSTYDEDGQAINLAGKYTGKVHLVGSAITYKF